MARESTLKVSILADAAQLKKALGEAEKSTKGFADKTDRMGKDLSRNLTVPLVGLGIAAFKMASDADEALSQVGQVFGEEADKVISASENVNDAFSQADYLSFAGNIGDVAQGLGIARGESDDLALSILDLAQDTASFKNVAPEQAVDAMTSALAGEREALKSLGIVIDDAMVKQKAQDEGLWDGVGTLDRAAAAQATYQLLVEKTSNSQGDFERTSDGAANKSRILAASLKDSAASMGQHLLPIGSAALEWVNNLLISFGNMPDGAQKVVLAFAGVAAAIGPLLIVISKLVSAFGTIREAMKKASTMMTSAGPWGVAIGGAIVVLGLLAQAHMDSQARIEEWRGAIEGGTEATEAHIDEILVAQFADEQWAAALDNSNLSIQDVKDALGDESKMVEVNTALLANNYQHVMDWLGAQANARDESIRLTEAEADLNEELGEGIERFPIIGGAIEGYRIVTDVATESTEELVAANQELYDAQQALLDPLFNLTNKTADAQAAQSRYNDAVSTFGIESPQARDAAMELATSTIELEAAAARYAAEGGAESIVQLEETLRLAGLTESEIRAVVDSIITLNNTPVTNVWTGGGATARGYGGGRQHGGPVAADKAYVVGEKGPELFMPNSNGRVIPAADPHTATTAPTWPTRPTTVIYMTINALDPQAAKKAVVEALQAYNRSDGPLPIDIRGS